MQNHRLLIMGMVGILTCCVVAGSASAFEGLNWLGCGSSQCSGCCDIGCGDCCDTGCGEYCDTACASSCPDRCDTSCGDYCGDCCGCDMGCDMGCGCGSGCGCGCDCLFYADALMLHRDSNYPNYPYTPLLGEIDGEGYNLNEIGIGATNGFQVGMIKKLRCCWDIEVRYQMFDGTGGFCFEEEGYYGPNEDEWGVEMESDYVSAVYSAEINFGKTYNCWLRPLIGFRWIELNERFSSDLLYWYNESAMEYQSEIKANNHLYGFQIGLDAILIDTCKFSILTGLRTGIYGNFCQQRTDLTIDSQETQRHYSQAADTTHTAFQAELSLMAEYTISCHWAIRGGYYLYWLEGIAQAPNQIGGMPRNGDDQRELNHPAVVTTGSPFYHGAMVGLEACW